MTPKIASRTCSLMAYLGKKSQKFKYFIETLNDWKLCILTNLIVILNLWNILKTLLKLKVKYIFQLDDFKPAIWKEFDSVVRMAVASRSLGQGFKTSSFDKMCVSRAGQRVSGQKRLKTKSLKVKV